MIGYATSVETHSSFTEAPWTCKPSDIPRTDDCPHVYNALGKVQPDTGTQLTTFVRPTEALHTKMSTGPPVTSSKEAGTMNTTDASRDHGATQHEEKTSEIRSVSHELHL